MPSAFTKRPDSSAANVARLTHATELQETMRLTFHYSYQETPRNPDLDDENRIGTMILRVPSVPVDLSEWESQTVVEFATTVAFSIIASCAEKNCHVGISREFLDSLPLLDVPNDQCPVCYEAYTPLPDESMFRRVEAGSDGPKRKRRKVGKQQQESVITIPQNDHQAVKLPCGHIFGRECLFTWLATSTTCPLCREEVHDDDRYSEIPQVITFPNISQLLSDGASYSPLVLELNAANDSLVSVPSSELELRQFEEYLSERLHPASVDSTLSGRRSPLQNGVTDTPGRRDAVAEMLSRLQERNLHTSGTGTLMAMNRTVGGLVRLNDGLENVGLFSQMDQYEDEREMDVHVAREEEQDEEEDISNNELEEQEQEHEEQGQQEIKEPETNIIQDDSASSSQSFQVPTIPRTQQPIDDIPVPTIPLRSSTTALLAPTPSTLRRVADDHEDQSDYYDIYDQD